MGHTYWSTKYPLTKARHKKVWRWKRSNRSARPLIELSSAEIKTKFWECQLVTVLASLESPFHWLWRNIDIDTKLSWRQQCWSISRPSWEHNLKMNILCPRLLVFSVRIMSTSICLDVRNGGHCNSAARRSKKAEMTSTIRRSLNSSLCRWFHWNSWLFSHTLQSKDPLLPAPANWL
jgi:hypothetical protein